MLCSMCNKNEAICERFVDSGFGKIKAYLCLDCVHKVVEPVEDVPSVSDFWNKDNFAIKCPKCGASLDDILDTNFVGCATCYDTFRTDIDRVISTIHGRSLHVGKVPEKILNNNFLSKNSKKQKDSLFGGAR